MDAHKLIDNFSTHLKNVIARSISIADSLNNPKVEPIHFLYSLVQEKGSIAEEILHKINLTEKLIFEDIIKDKQTQKTNTDIPELNNFSKKIIEKALILAHDKKHNYIGTEHLLFGILDSKDKELVSYLKKLNLTKELISKEINIAFKNVDRFSNIENIKDTIENNIEIDNNFNPEDISPENLNSLPPNMIPMLNNIPKINKKKENIIQIYTKNLTSKQEQIKIDPVIGREKEIERIINILARRTKNNPILVGEPGVGKTAIIEGLAKKIYEKNVPEILKNKKILSLDLTLLISGTIYRGEFESRLKQIIDECTHNPNYILFIDELHNIIGAGSNQGTMDAANILKPALARGDLRCIGATTFDEYKKYISNDPALERRFQKIDIEEPNTKDTINIIKGIKKYYENFHNVNISNEIIDEAVKLSNRYIHDNFQPDKSIDLIDEASGMAKINQVIDEETKKINELETKIQEKTETKEELILEEKLKEALKEKKEIEKLEKKLQELKNKKTSSKKTKVTLKNLHYVLANKVHIDETILGKDEWENLKNLEKRVIKNIIGQDKIINKIVTNLKKSYLGLKKENKPLASFLFNGPSGVGKTELAKILAKEIYHDEKSLIKLNMAEFTEGHSVSKLLGSPAGYIGYKDRNPILEKIKQRPYSVILFDEIDRAHSDVKKMLLQILDEGYITDNNSKKINLKHSIIILTSNLGSEFYKNNNFGFDKVAEQEKNKLDKNQEKNITKKIKQELGTDIISRLTEICVFNPLSEKEIEKIILKNISELDDKFKKDIKKIITNKEIEKIINKINFIDFGARNIENEIEKIIHNFLLTQKEMK